jgi:hypothetical protein
MSMCIYIYMFLCIYVYLKYIYIHIHIIICIGLVTFKKVGEEDVRAYLKSSVDDVISDGDIHAVPQCEEIKMKINEMYILNLYKKDLFIIDLLDIKSAVIHRLSQINSDIENSDIFNDIDETNKNLKILEKKNLEKNFMNEKKKKKEKNEKSSILGIHFRIYSYNTCASIFISSDMFMNTKTNVMLFILQHYEQMCNVYLLNIYICIRRSIYGSWSNAISM